MTRVKFWRQFLSSALCLLLGPVMLLAQTAPAVPKAADKDTDKEFVAVMAMQAIGADAAQATAMTDRLREELLKSGKYVLVDRAQMDAILNEQAFQQTGCTSSECAVQVGKVLGVRKIISGRITKVGDNQWLMASTITDVETAETVKTVSVRYEGSFFDMLDNGITQLAKRLGSQQTSDIPAIVTGAPTPAMGAAQPEEKPSTGISKWWYVAGGVAVLAAVAGGSKGGGGGGGGGVGGGGGGGGSSCSTCTSVTAHW